VNVIDCEGRTRNTALIIYICGKIDANSEEDKEGPWSF